MKQILLICLVLIIGCSQKVEFIVKKPPASFYIKKEVNLKKGSGATGISDPVAKITTEQLKKIAEEKLPDLNTSDIDQAAKIIAGTARSMGVEVVD